MAVVEIHPDCLREDLAEIPDRRVVEAILRKVAALESAPELGKPLVGVLAGHRRITYGRYRILYRWDRNRDHVLVWYVGLRTEGLYRVARTIAGRRAGPKRMR